jgi:hypothetical protein
MHRRSFISVLGGAAAQRSSIGLAQEFGRVYRLGFVVQRQRAAYAVLLEELRRLGFVERRNLLLDARGFGSPSSSSKRLPLKRRGRIPTRSSAAAKQRPSPREAPPQPSRSWRSQTISSATGSSPRWLAPAAMSPVSALDRRIRQ